MTWRIAVDTGGTFNDVCLYDEETSELAITKVSSNPTSPGAAVMTGVGQILEQQGHDLTRGLGKVSAFAHGTTVATNALLEGNGALTGLITTWGFRDLLELARQRRPKLYDLAAKKPTPMVPRHLRREVSERVLFDGSIRAHLDEQEIREVASELREAGVEAIAILFLYSYLNTEHEEVTERIVREELPEAFVSTSHVVMPEFREYERLSTTVVNAFIGPTMQHYLSSLRRSLANDGLKVQPYITQSNGGVARFATAEKLPVKTILSGPSAGVMGAASVAEGVGIRDLITFDMGGTSSDVSLVRDGRPSMTNGMVLEGIPIQTSMVDVNTVGAGGGSIGWVDDGGHLKVGPRSAGASPGPACYGLGNSEPTVTDANVVLGTLNAEALLGGSMPIDADLALKAMERLGDQLGMEPLEAAKGMIRIVTANMVRAIRVVSVQRGLDPGDYVLVAFGGAGPLHASALARELGMDNIIVPRYPGALSALGLLMTDLRADFSQTLKMPLVASELDEIRNRFASLDQSADEWLDHADVVRHRRELRRYVDVRYAGQNYELRIAAAAGEIDGAWLLSLIDAFHAAYEARYGYRTDAAAVEATTFRVEAIGVIERTVQQEAELHIEDSAQARIGVRQVHFPGEPGSVECPIYDRSLLLRGNCIWGPAIVDQYDSTVLLLPGDKGEIDGMLNLQIKGPS